MTVLTVPATWADDDVVTKDQLDAVSDLQRWYWGSRPLFHGTCATDNTLADSTWFPVPLRTDTAVLNGIKRGFTHTDGTANVTATVPGWYDFTFQGGFAATANGDVGARAAVVAKNGSIVGSRIGPYHDSEFGTACYAGSGTVWLNGTTDYLTLSMYKTGGTGVVIHTAHTNVRQYSQLGIWWVGRDLT